MHKSKTIFYIPDNMSLNIDRTQYDDLTIKDIISVDNGIIALDHSFKNTGVYYPDGTICKESVLQRYNINKTPNNHKSIHKAKYVDESVIYLGTGYMFEHFGHFLIEGTNRFWPLLYSKYQHYRVAIAMPKRKNIPAFVRKMLNAIGVRDQDIIIVNKNTQFARVFVPRQSTHIDVNVLPITKRVYDKIAEGMDAPKIKTFNKIYLSRGAMNDGRTFGEKQIENIFAKNGFKIIYPEKLPLEHQIVLAKNCKEMAGTAGSALHLAFFMKPGGRVIQIKRNSNNADNVNIQSMICRACNLDLILVAGSIEPCATDHFTLAPQILGITPQMLAFFNDNNFKYKSSDIKNDDETMSLYMKQLRIYHARVKYEKITRLPIRLISVIGITKHGRECIRESLKHLLRVRI